MEDQKPILRLIARPEASKISPWPERIAGTEPWSKPNAPRLEARAEYEHGWYAGLLTKWTDLFGTLPPHQRHPGAALHFFDEVRRSNNSVMASNTAVYGSVDVEEFLVSVADQLYAADVNLMEVLWRSFIVERAQRAQTFHPFEVVIEAGCGNGVNLHNLYSRLGLASIGGCDLSHNAVAFLKRMAEDLGVDATFRAGDYGDVGVFKTLAPASKSWALLSVHAIEQTEHLTANWFSDLVALPNPPTLGMHFEPLHWGDDTVFAKECARYAELNGYNKNFLNAVRAAEASGVVRVIHTEKRVLGHSAYNPTSVLMWVPS